MERSKNPRDSPDDSDRLFKKPRSEKIIAPSLGSGSAAPSSAPAASLSGLSSPITQSKPIFEFPSDFLSFGNRGLSNPTGTPLFGQAAPAAKLELSGIPSTAPPLVDPTPIADGNRSNAGTSPAPIATFSYGTGPGAFGLSAQQSGSRAAAPNAQQEKAKPAESASATTNSAGIKQDGCVTIKQDEDSGTLANTSLAQRATVTTKRDKDSETKAKKALFNTQADAISGPIESLDPRGDLLLVAGVTKVNFRVCSRTLSLSSPAWEEKIYGPLTGSGPFSERKSQQGEYGWVLRVPEDDPEALRIVLKAVHYKLGDVPSILSRESLFHLTVLCDKYDMIGLLKPFWRGWLSGLPPPQPLDSKTFVQQVWIAQKLGDLHSYKTTILEFLYSAQKVPGAFFEKLFLDNDIDLHQDQYLRKLGIIGKSALKPSAPGHGTALTCIFRLTVRLAWARSKAARAISQRLSAAIDTLSNPAFTNCAYNYGNQVDWQKTCDCAMLGAVLRCLHGKSWYSSGKSDWADLVPFSVRQLVAKVDGIRSAAIGESRMRRKQGNTHKDCTPWARFDLVDILGEHNLAAHFHVDQRLFQQRAEKSGLSTSVASN
jgi:hypothetical protein